MSATVDDVLSLLDEMNEQGRIEYGGYSQLHDAITATLPNVDKGIPQGADGNLDQSQVDWLRLMPDGWDGTPPTLGGGKLTAEQVRELIAPHLQAKPTFDFGRHGAVWRADFQAIADELNAAMGGEECEIDHERYCSNCGVYVHEDAVLVRKSLGNGTWTVVNKPVSYCPNCGKAVKR